MRRHCLFGIIFLPAGENLNESDVSKPSGTWPRKSPAIYRKNNMNKLTYLDPDFRHNACWTLMDKLRLRLYEYSRNWYHEKLLRYNGGTQKCPWCNQLFQEYTTSLIQENQKFPDYEHFTCGNCRGGSYWQWGYGFHFRCVDVDMPPRGNFDLD